jgi:hypothetical protein
MKNIHLLPTDKPSRLCINGKNQMHIYITNDEEIKEGDCYIDFTSDGLKIEHFKTKDDWVLVGICDSKKIILTTDQDLIKDGVQAIPDEFLEWFVKNPSCEWVEIANDLKYFNVDELRERHLKRLPHLYSESIGYKIIIPKEEPKQETLREVAEKYYNNNIFCDGITEFEHDVAIRCYIAGAKHTAERMYSEKDMAESFIACWKSNIPDGIECKVSFKEWFEQFKKK